MKKTRTLVDEKREYVCNTVGEVIKTLSEYPTDWLVTVFWDEYCDDSSSLFAKETIAKYGRHSGVCGIKICPDYRPKSAQTEEER